MKSPPVPTDRQSNQALPQAVISTLGISFEVSKDAISDIGFLISYTATQL